MRAHHSIIVFRCCILSNSYTHKHKHRHWQRRLPAMPRYTLPEHPSWENNCCCRRIYELPTNDLQIMDLTPCTVFHVLPFFFCQRRRRGWGEGRKTVYICKENVLVVKFIVISFFRQPNMTETLWIATFIRFPCSTCPNRIPLSAPLLDHVRFRVPFNICLSIYRYSIKW